MRKILIGVLVALMLIGLIFFMVNGFTKINIKGVRGIDEKDTQINDKITDLSNISSVKYKEAESNLKQAAAKLIDVKTEYENQAALSNSNSSSYASKLETYDIDYLWTKLGNYAKDENVVIKIDVTAGGASSNLYNLNFTVTGTYVGTTDFIYDIENDSKLGFKIDEFKMIAGNGTEVTGTFVCQDIPISVGNIEGAPGNDSSATQAQGDNTNNNQQTGAESNTTNNANTNTNTTTTTNTSSNNPAEQYGLNSDPNKSNLTAINDVIHK